MPISLLKHIIQGNVAEESFRKILPHASLIGHIDCFYIVSCEDSLTNQLIFNDGLPTLVFMANTESVAKIVIDEDVTDIKGGWVSGGTIKNTYIKNLSNTDYLLVVRFNPTCFSRIFEINANVFKNNRIISIQEILKSKGKRLLSSVFRANNMDDKIYEIESHVINSESSDYYLGLLNEAVKLINEQKGRVSVIDISNKIGANYKWLERNFSRYIGLTPKEYARIQRFIHMYFDLTENLDKDFLSIAIQNGYYDQSHLFRDFKSYVGTSPLQYLNASKANIT